MPADPKFFIASRPRFQAHRRPNSATICRPVKELRKAVSFDSAASSNSGLRCPPIFDLLEVQAQPAKDLVPLGIAELLPKFGQSKVDHVVMMNLLRGNVIAQFKPNPVQQISLLGREPRRMGTQVENVFLSAGKINFQRQ